MLFSIGMQEYYLKTIYSRITETSEEKKCSTLLLRQIFILKEIHLKIPGIECLIQKTHLLLLKTTQCNHYHV